MNQEDVRVLVVDDDEAINESLRGLLETYGYNVRTVQSGEAALQDAENIRPTCVIVDLDLPGGIDGVQLIARLRALYAHDMVIIVLTGLSGTSHGHAGAEQAGADYVFAKPIDVDKLRRIMPPVV